MVTSNGEAALQQLLSIVCKDYERMDDAESMIEKVTKKFQSIYDKPPVSEFEQLLQKTFSAEEVRIALFSPLEEQYEYYPRLFMATNGVPLSHPFCKVRHLILSLVFLVHRKNDNFRSTFIICGGLQHLCHMLLEENLYIRGQAIELFVAFTDCDDFDWYATPRNDKERLMHKQMLLLSDHPEFLINLTKNRINSYPGGNVRSFQILAFWLSWVRMMYTPDKLLKLSPALLKEIQLWGGSVEPHDVSFVEFADGVYKDFSEEQFTRGGTVKPKSENNNEDEQSVSESFTVHGINSEKIEGSNYDSIVNSDLDSKVDEHVSNKKSNHPDEEKNITFDSIVALKIVGNNYFKENKLKESIKVYEEALQDLGT